MSARSGRAAWGWALLAWALCLVPLVGHALVPATDLPQHLGISTVLWRLWHHDPGAAAYAAQLQPTPYYLAYGLLAPLAGFAGPEAGARLFLALVAAMQVGATALLLRAARTPAWANLATPFAFFGPVFYYGFVATLVGVPPLVLTLARLLRFVATGRWRTLAQAGAAALAATLSHAVLAVPTGLLALAALRRLPDDCRSARQRWLGAAVLAGCAGLPLLPAVWAQLAAAGGTHGTLTAAAPAVQWRYFLGFLGPFDHGLGRAAHLGALALIAWGAWRQRESTAARLVVPAVVALAVAFAVCPRAWESETMVVWGVSFRLLCVAEAWALCLLAPQGAGRRHAHAVLAGLIVLVGVHGAAQWRLWDRFEAAAAPLYTVVRALPPGGRLAIETAGEVALPHAFPPLLSHLGAYYLAHGGACLDGIFTGAHLPLRTVRPCPRGAADFLLQRAATDGTWPADAPPGASWHYVAGPWRLAALPAALASP